MYLPQFIFKQHLGYALIICICFTGCKVGPNFHAPGSPPTNKFIQDVSLHKTTKSPNSGSGGKAQYFHLGQDIPAAWWHIFHSTDLNTFILAGLNNNASLAAATAALIQAQEMYRAQIGTLFPTVTGNASAERQRFSFSEFGGSSTGPIGARIFNLFNLNIAVAYTVDVFGMLRRQIEAAKAQAENQQFELEAAFLTLSSNIATTAITIASLKEQIAATVALIQLQQKTLSLIKKQYALGGVSRTDILLQENQLAQTKATLPPFVQSLEQKKHLLSVLIGELPTEHTLPELNLQQLNLPADLPLTCPSTLVRQRPDIRAAEALLHVASAQIGVATANLFPQLTINGAYGQQSEHLSNLFKHPNNIWNITGGLTQPIFSGGTLLAQRRASIAAYEQAAALYKQTVLQAFQNVADVLRALENDAQLLKFQREAERAAFNSLNLIQKQYFLGGIDYLTLLTAQRAYQQARVGRIQAQSARYTDTIALFQSLGGGWWNRCAINCSPLLQHNLQQYKPDVFGKG